MAKLISNKYRVTQKIFVQRSNGNWLGYDRRESDCLCICNSWCAKMSLTG